MGLEWAIPAAGQAYEHREEIATAWESLVSLLFGKKRSIAITGMAGAGKTVLLDHLSGKAFDRSYAPAGTSKAAEQSKMPAGKRRLRLTTVPGQDSRPRVETLDELFTDDHAVDGVIHVVCNGFVTTREPNAERVLLEDLNLTSVQKYRDHQMGEELRDLEDTCDLIRASIRRTKSPKWILVAVTKVDLFHEVDQLRAAEQYYGVAAKSRFADRLRLLQNQIGSDNLDWGATPVCAWLDDFRWGGVTRHSRLTEAQRNALLTGFAKTLEGYCDGGAG